MALATIGVAGGIGIGTSMLYLNLMKLQALKGIYGELTNIREYLERTEAKETDFEEGGLEKTLVEK